LRWASSDRCPCHRAPCTGPVGCDALPPLSCRTPAKPKEKPEKRKWKGNGKKKRKAHEKGKDSAKCRPAKWPAGSAQYIPPDSELFAHTGYPWEDRVYWATGWEKICI